MSILFKRRRTVCSDESQKAVDVYLARIPDKAEYDTLYPSERDAEVRAVANDEVKKHKYYAWRLLDYALKHSFGYNTEQLEITKAAGGKWLCPNCDFSISHSAQVVAIAVSRAPVGIDVQVEKTLASSTFEQRMLTEKERAALKLADSAKVSSEELIRLWTKKESIFKTLNSDIYIPAEIDTSQYNTYDEIFEIGDNKYYLSVFSPDLSKIRIFKDINLQDKY